MITLKRITAIISKIKEQPLKKDVLFFIAVTLIGSIIYLGSKAIQSLNSAHSGFPDQGFGTLVILIASTILLVISGLALMLLLSLVGHFFVLFTDGHRDFEKTMKAVIYASALPVLFAWTFHIVQYSALVLAAAFLVVAYIGIYTFHEITKDRAAFVAIFTTGFIIVLLYIGKLI